MKALCGGTIPEEYWANREVVENKSIVGIRFVDLWTSTLRVEVHKS